MADFLGGIPPALLDGVGVVGLIVLFAVLLASGRLVTGKAHDQAMQDLRDSHAKALEDRDRQIVDWRDAFRAEQATNTVTTSQLDKLIEQGRTFVHLFDSLRAVTQTAAPDEGETS